MGVLYPIHLDFLISFWHIEIGISAHLLSQILKSVGISNGWSIWILQKPLEKRSLGGQRYLFEPLEERGHELRWFNGVIFIEIIAQLKAELNESLQIDVRGRFHVRLLLDVD